jgi:large subunit ribosomal protein L23
VSGPNPRDLLKHYLTTEKNSILKENSNVYVFEVARRANKLQVRAAVEQIFNVQVTGVNISVAPKKPKRLGRFAGYRPGYKKAYVTLKAGDQIEVFENV